MRSLMLVLSACLVALNFAGCSSTGGCNGGCGFLGGGLMGARSGGCSGGCGDTSCGGGCSDTSCGGGGSQNSIKNINYGGSSGLGLGLMEAGPSCKASGCNGGGCDSGGCNGGGCDSGCQSCRRGLRPQLGSRMQGRLKGGMQGLLAKRGCECGGGTDCGCGSPTLATLAPALPETDYGSAASGSAGFSMTDMADIGSGYGCDGECDGGIELVSHEDRGGLLGKLFGGHRKGHGARGGCGAKGCGGPGGLCSRCRARLGGAFGAGANSIPHRDPTIHSGGAAAGPAGQIPTYAYPYYTTRAPRDFLDPSPPTIGY